MKMNEAGRNDDIQGDEDELRAEQLILDELYEEELEDEFEDEE